MGALPQSVRISELYEGLGIEAAVAAHNAKWHYSPENIGMDVGISVLANNQRELLLLLVSWPTSGIRDLLLQCICRSRSLFVRRLKKHGIHG